MYFFLLSPESDWTLLISLIKINICATLATPQDVVSCGNRIREDQDDIWGKYVQ